MLCCTYRVDLKTQEVFLTQSGFVYHMETDLLNTGNILFSNGTDLVTANQTTAMPLSGNRGIEYRYFTQLNAETVICGWEIGNCLVILNRSTEAVENYAGKCNEYGDEVGSGEVARFSTIFDIIKDVNEESIIYVCDFGNNKIKVIESQTRNVASGLDLVLYGYSQPTTLAWHNQSLLIIVREGILKARVSVEPKIEGRLSSPTVVTDLAGIYRVYPTKVLGVFFFTLSSSTNIHILDFVNNKGDGEIKLGEEFTTARSLLTVGEFLFVGQIRKIWRLKGIIM